MSDESENAGNSEDEYDPFEYVPDRIDTISASGLVEMQEACEQ